MNLCSWENCPKEVKDQKSNLNEILDEHLGDNLLGTYLHGSLALQSFNPNSGALEDKGFWSETPVDGDIACHLTLINKKGICIFGLPIKEAFSEIPETDFRSSIVSGVDYAISVLTTLPVYGILTLCRVLSYLETGEILSKRDAGMWALSIIPENLRYIVRSAVEVYEGTRSDMVVINDVDLMNYKGLMQGYSISR